MNKIGIAKEHVTDVTDILNGFLSDEVVLYIKTRRAHWNVEGADFYEKHKFFEGQYEELAKIMDEVAERVRLLGQYPAATLKSFLELTSLKEQNQVVTNSSSLIKDLLADHENMIIRMRENLDVLNNELQDAGTADFITGLMQSHEKMAWMLRAHLK